MRKLLNDQLKTQSKKNLVQSRLFSDMLQKTIQKYQNRSLDTAEIIAELVNLAKNMREAQSRGDKLGLFLPCTFWAVAALYVDFRIAALRIPLSLIYVLAIIAILFKFKRSRWAAASNCGDLRSFRPFGTTGAPSPSARAALFAALKSAVEKGLSTTGLMLLCSSGKARLRVRGSR